MKHQNNFEHRHFDATTGCRDGHGRHGHNEFRGTAGAPDGGHSRREHHGRTERGRHGGTHVPHGRARRGEARYILLDALRGGAKHGYEIIKTIEERSGGQYSPSPGTVYPTMQFLGELGLVSTTVEGERRVFQLTPAGTEDLDEHAAEIAEFWERFALPTGSRIVQREVEFLREELDDLSRTVWGGRSAGGPNGIDCVDVLREIRAAVGKCRNDVRGILTKPSDDSEGS